MTTKNRWKILQKKYRPNVAAIIVSSRYPNACEFFVAQRADIKGVWQFPQGGIDANETPKEALLRELKEEIGTDFVEIIAECPKWISYDFPNIATKKMYQYDGQIQKYFLVRIKKESDINLDTAHPEFISYQFVKYDALLELVNHFKKNVYKEVLDYFKKEGYL
ncbi:RNA pyrophosphohydrolase [Helicobacter anatolicus]|uniref:RNA pyrophosphohydrolase n=1 Tax=Helicobacter anatolicus TaxID=2905874 RepID=UPI001E2D3757|nr:RNA pyrophosphohydrolase [Helicobacter anatolicus]MCE3038757.1 RNA pyrophosphohydrolase [Helicobacter anatolicus]